MPDEAAKMEALFPNIQNIRDVLKFLNAAAIKDVFALVADFRAHDPTAEKADLAKLFTDLEMPELAGIAPELFDIVTFLITLIPSTTPADPSPIRMMGAAPSEGDENIFGLRLRLARQLAKEKHTSGLVAYVRLRRVSNDTLLRATHRAAVNGGFQSPVGADATGFAFDGHLIAQLFAWVQAHPEIISAILSLIMLFL